MEPTTFNLTEMLKHLDFNMSAGTVLVAIAGLYLTFVGVRWAWNSTTSAVSNAFSGLISWAGPSTVFGLMGLLALGGTTSVGLGVGELNSGDRPEDKVAVAPLTNNDIVKMATSEKVTKETLDLLVKYAKDRDDAQVKMLEKVKTEHFVSTRPEQVTPNAPNATIDTPNRRTGWMEVIGGIGALLCSIGIGCYRFATWNGRTRDSSY
jgi:hypothetical protein